jgi:hypothetical protein
MYIYIVCGNVELYVAVESESEGILGGVGVGKNVPTQLPTPFPQSKILTRYSNSRALRATITIRLILKYRL